MLPDWLVALIQPRPTCIYQLELLWPELSVMQQAEVLERIKTVEYGQWLFQSIWDRASHSSSDYLRYRTLAYQQGLQQHRPQLDSDPCPLVRALSTLSRVDGMLSPQHFWQQPQLERLHLLAHNPSPVTLARLLTYAADHRLCQRECVSETDLASLILEVMPGLLDFSRHSLCHASDYMGEPLFLAFRDLWRLIPKLPGRAGYELLNRLPWQLDGRALACAEDLQHFTGLLKWGLDARLEKDYNRLPHDLMKAMITHAIELEDALVEYWIETVRWDLGTGDLTLITTLPESMKRQRLRLLALHAPLEFDCARISCSGSADVAVDASPD